MNEADRLAGRMKELALKHATSPPARREEALVDLLRKELDRVPQEEIFGLLTKIRDSVAGSRKGEASRLWECLSNITVQEKTHPEPPAQPVPRPADTNALEEAILGRERKKDVSLDPEAQKRLLGILAEMIENLDVAEAEFQRTILMWRKSQQLHGRAGETIFKLRTTPGLRKTFAKALYEGGEHPDLEKRIKLLGLSPSLVYVAFDRAVSKSLQSIRNLIDPQKLDEEHGREAWAKYRQHFKNRLQSLGREFQEEYFSTRFLEEFFESYRKL